MHHTNTSDLATEAAAAVPAAAAAAGTAAEPETFSVTTSPVRSASGLRLKPDGTTISWAAHSFRTCWCAPFSFLTQLVLVAATGSFLFGFNLSLLNTSMDHIGYEFGWCDRRRESITGCTAFKNYSAFVVTAVFIGAAIGSMTGGSMLYMGRRSVLLLSLAVFSLGIISSVCANSFAALLWARLVVGYGVGLVSVVCPTYMAEITPPSVRGRYGVFHQLFVTIGILSGTLVGLPLALKSPVPDTIPSPPIDRFSQIWWRLMLGIGILPVMLTSYLLLAVFRFETPYYYVERGQTADAEQLLKRLTGHENVDAELAQIKESVQQQQRAKAGGKTLGQAIKARKDYRWVIFVGCLFSAFQQLGGINVFIASSNRLFKDAGLSGKWPTITSNIMNLINCLMTLPAVPLIESLGRRTLMLIGTIGMTCSVAPAAIAYLVAEHSEATKWLAILGCIFFIVFFAMTYGPILWVWLFEIFPMEIRGAASGAATAVNWIAGIAMVFVTAYLHNREAFVIFFVMCLLSAILVALYLKETKGTVLGNSPYIDPKAEEDIVVV